MTQIKQKLGIIMRAIIKIICVFTFAFLLKLASAATPPLTPMAATSSADNLDVPLTEYSSFDGTYQVATGGQSFFTGGTTAGNFSVNIPACSSGSTPNIIAAYLNWYQRHRSNDAFVATTPPTFDDDLLLDFNSTGNQTVSVTDDYWARLDAGSNRTFIRRYVMSDITALVSANVVSGVNSFDISDLLVPTPDSSDPDVRNSETYGVGAIIVYECAEFNYVSVKTMAGLDWFYDPQDTPYIGNYSDLACVTFPALSSAQTVQLEGVFGGQERAGAPFRGARLFYQTGSGVLPSTDSTQATGPSDVLISTGTQLGAGYESVWVSNLGAEWDRYSNTVSANAGDEWVCLQAESAQGGTSAPGISGDLLSPVFLVPRDAPVTAGCTTVTNSASITSVNESDTDNSNNSSSIAVNINCQTNNPDISLVKTASTTEVLAGDTLTYTLVARNTGSEDATDVIITDALPVAQVNYSSDDGGAATSVDGSGVLTWDIGTLPAGGTATLDITVIVN